MVVGIVRTTVTEIVKSPITNDFKPNEAQTKLKQIAQNPVSKPLS